MRELMKIPSLILLFCTSFGYSQSLPSAAKLFKAGQFTEAAAICRQILVQNPKNADAIELLGDVYASQRKWDDALQQFTTLKSLKPGVANYHYKYGGAMGMVAKDSNKFKALGMISDIRESFEKAIAIEPRHIDARWALIELNLQLPAIVGGSEDKAQRYATQLATLSPVDGYLAKGHIAEYYRRYAVAEKYYKAAINIGKSKTTYQKLADLYKNKMNQPDKAALVMQQYLKQSTKP